jgi:hypothetical protein
MTAGFVINPNARGGKGAGQMLADALAGKPGLRAERLDRFDDLSGILKTFGEEGFTTLFLSGGDGTVQATQTLLAENNWFEAKPRLALLAHGSTNMTASTLGFKPRDPDRIMEIAASGDYLARATDVKQRHTIRVVNPRNGGPRHGMFIGSGAIWRATKFCQNVVHEKGVRGEWATFATLATVAGRFLFAKQDEDDDDRIAQAYPMTVKTDGAVMTETDQLIFLATTLESLILGATPFWGKPASEMRVTSIDFPPPNLPAHIMKVMYGIPNRNLPASCRSRSATNVEIKTEASFVIDGEFFDPPSDAPLRLELGQNFSYLCG